MTFPNIMQTFQTGFNLLLYGPSRRKWHQKLPTPGHLLRMAENVITQVEGDREAAIEAYLELARKDPTLAEQLSDSAMSRIFYGRRRHSVSVRLLKESKRLENRICKALHLARGETRKASRIFREWLQTEPTLIEDLHRWEIRRILSVF